MGNFAGENFLLGGGNMKRGDFDNSNLFQSLRQYSVNIKHQLKIKISMTHVYKEYQVKINMVYTGVITCKNCYLLRGE